MTPERLEQCLLIIRWTPDTLARCFGCDSSLVEAWLNGEADVPPKAAAWIETVAAYMEIAEGMKPKGMKGKRFKG
jgi:hypothetical protein